MMRLLAAAFGLGVVTDLIIAQFYLAIASRRVALAAVLSILVTAIPFFITERAINTKRKVIFVWYALGCGAGTALGLMISI